MQTVDIRLPELGGGSQEEQLRKMQRYLFSLAEQLQFAFDCVEQEQSRTEQVLQTANREKTPAETFNSIKALIVKSADLVEQYTDEVESRLRGIYTAESAFGTFRQETQQRITENAEAIQRSFTNVQELNAAVAEISDMLSEVNAYIRTGLLYYGESGGGVYGVEIGQQEAREGVVVFRKFARLTAEKLSFYDSSDNEVAYISDFQLHVTEAAMQRVQANRLAVQRLELGEYAWVLGADGHLTLG